MDQAEETWLEGSTGGGGPGGPPPASFTGVSGSLVASQGPPPGSQVDPFASNNPITQTIRERQEGFALFGQATYPVTDRFRLIAGIRKNNEPSTTKYRIIVYNVTADGKYGTNPNVPGYVSNLYDQTTEVADPTAPGGVRHVYDTGIAVYKLKKSPFDYTGGMEFDLGKNSMLYATYKTSFKKGGLNFQTSVPPQTYDPETIKAYTLGTKNRFMNNQLQLNAEAYYYDYDGAQVFCATQYWDELSQSTRQAMMIINAKKTQTFGMEVSTDWMVTANDRISTSLAYMNTEYGEITLPANPMAGSDEFVLTGTDLPNAPHWSGTLGYEHIFTLDSGATITPSLRTKVTAGYWNTHEKYLAGSYTEGFRQSQFFITYADASGKYNVSLWCKNLENKAITNYAFPRYRKFIGEPRTTGLTFSAKF
jgi:iron complex outermembrane receptor protein